MSRNKKRNFSKCGDYVEIIVGPRVTYEDLISACAKEVHPPKDQSMSTPRLSLFRADGTVVPPHSLDGGEWVLEDYLKSINRKPHQIRFGVGFVYAYKVSEIVL